MVRNTYRLNWLYALRTVSQSRCFPFPQVHVQLYVLRTFIGDCPYCVRFEFGYGAVLVALLPFSELTRQLQRCQKLDSRTAFSLNCRTQSPKLCSLRSSPLPQHSSIIPRNFEDPTAELPSSSASSFKMPIVLFIIVVILRFLPFQFATFLHWIEHGKKVILCQGWKFYLFWKQC